MFVLFVVMGRIVAVALAEFVMRAMKRMESGDRTQDACDCFYPSSFEHKYGVVVAYRALPRQS